MSELTQWVKCDGYTKLAILERAKEIRPELWPNIAARIAEEFDVRVSYSCLYKHCTPGQMERHRANGLRYWRTHKQYYKERRDQVDAEANG